MQKDLYIFRYTLHVYVLYTQYLLRKKITYIFFQNFSFYDKPHRLITYVVPLMPFRPLKFWSNIPLVFVFFTSFNDSFSDMCYISKRNNLPIKIITMLCFILLTKYFLENDCKSIFLSLHKTKYKKFSIFIMNYLQY